MKLPALALMWASSSAALLAWTIPAHAQAAMTCTNDTDCAAGGAACGGDVCSWKVTPHKCVAAGGPTPDPGWCSGATQAAANMKCKCRAEGATCDLVTKHCTFTTIPDGGASGSGSTDAGGAEAAVDDSSASSGDGSVDDGSAASSGSVDDGSAASSGSATSGSSGSATSGSSGSATSGSATSGSSSGSASSSGAGSLIPEVDGGASNGGGSSSSSSCSVGFGTSSPWGLGIFAFGGCLALARRRRRA